MTNDSKAETDTRSEAAKLSALMYQARESLEMWADVVETRVGKPDAYTRGLVQQIDEYRAERGWPANGWGGEVDPE